MILAIDIGTKLGWAYGDKNMIVSGVEHFKVDRFSGGGMRFLKFKLWLSEFRNGVLPDTVVYEEVRRHMGTDAAHVYGGLLAVLTSWCEENEIPYTGVPVGTIKKYWTGKGNANKEQMIAACKERGVSVKDDNEADAYALLKYWINKTAKL